MTFNHFDNQGHAIMVDVSEKQPTMRTAIATATVSMHPETLAAIQTRTITKGDVLSVARLAGISAAKKTPELIPLAHPLAIHYTAIEFKINEDAGTIAIEASAKAFERTGVEMEAMTAASVAALTIYDMCKKKDKGITINEVALVAKEGGNSGPWKRPAR